LIILKRRSQRDAHNLENDTLDLLLFNFLQELVYYKDSELLLLEQQVHVEEKERNYYLIATTQGERLIEIAITS